MSVPGDPALERECRVFARYLLRVTPSDYVVAKYVEAHTVSAAYRPDHAFDTWLVTVAGRSLWWAALADGFASLQRGDLARAIAQFRESARRDPGMTSATGPEADAVAQAAAAFRTGMVDEARAQLESVLMQSPERAEVHRLVVLIEEILHAKSC